MTVGELIARLKNYDEEWKVEAAYFYPYDRERELVRNTGIVSTDLFIGTNKEVGNTVLIGSFSIRNILDKVQHDG